MTPFRRLFVLRWPGELTVQLAAIALLFQALLVGFGHGAGSHAAAGRPMGLSGLVICTPDGTKVAPDADDTAPNPARGVRCACAILCRDTGDATSLGLLPSERAFELPAAPAASAPAGSAVETWASGLFARGLRPEVRGPPVVSA